MKDINKILLFLTFVIIYISSIYVLTLQQEVEMEFIVSNALLYDINYPKYDDGTYIGDWQWMMYQNEPPKLELVPNCNSKWNRSCTQHIQWSNQTLNGTSYIHIKTPINILYIAKYVMYRYYTEK